MVETRERCERCQTPVEIAEMPDAWPFGYRVLCDVCLLGLYAVQFRWLGVGASGFGEGC